MTDPEGDAECPDAPDVDADAAAAAEPAPAEEVWYTGRERFTRSGRFTPIDPEQVMAAIEQGLAGHRMLSPLEQQCVALREFYLALRTAGFTQDEAFDYLHRQQQ